MKLSSLIETDLAELRKTVEPGWASHYPMLSPWCTSIRVYYVHLDIYMYTYMCMCMNMFIYEYMYIYIYMYRYVHVGTCVSHAGRAQLDPNQEVLGCMLRVVPLGFRGLFSGARQGYRTMQVSCKGC